MQTMSEPTDYPGMSCDEFAAVAAELALGVLTGRERAAALAHLDGCESCRELVRELTTTGEELLALLPSREPPAGFETRVLERIGLPAAAGNGRPSQGRPSPRRHASHSAERRANRPPGRPRDRVRSLVSAAAVALALVGAALGGWGIRAVTEPAASHSTVQSTSALSTAALVTPANQTVGLVAVSNRSPSWMSMSVNLGEVAGNVTVKCQLEDADGTYTWVGNFHLTEGYGTWGSPYTTGDSIVGARLLSANNTVLATATFS
jgi:anti-sigma-K factor RskA